MQDKNSSNRNSMQKFKVVLVGDQNVGKSSIISRYIKNQFDPTKNPTIGIDFISKNISMMGKMVRLQLWDTAGQQRFRDLIPGCLKDAHLTILVFDLTNVNSVENLNKWINFLRQSGKKDIIIYVVGNKNDLQEQISTQGRRVAKEIAGKQAENYKQVSAKTASNIDNLFNEIIDEIMSQTTTNQKEAQNQIAPNPQLKTKQVSTQDNTDLLGLFDNNSKKAEINLMSKQQLLAQLRTSEQSRLKLQKKLQLQQQKIIAMSFQSTNLIGQNLHMRMKVTKMETQNGKQLQSSRATIDELNKKNEELLKKIAELQKQRKIKKE